MNSGTIQVVRQTLGLMTPAERAHYVVFLLLQCLAALLDLLALVCIGLLVLVATQRDAGQDISLLGMTIPLGSQTDADRWALILSGIALFALILKGIGYTYLLRTTLRFLARVSNRLALEVVAKMLANRNPTQTSQQISYDVVVGSAHGVTTLLSALSVVAGELVLLTVLSAALLMFDPLVTGALLVYLAAVTGMIHKRLGVQASTLGHQRAENQSLAMALIQETIQASRVIEVTHRRGVFIDRIGPVQRRFSESVSGELLLGHLPKVLFELALIVGGSVLVIWQVNKSSLTDAIALLAVYLVAASRLLPSLMRLVGQYVVLRTASTASASFRKLGLEAQSVEHVPAAEGARARDTRLNEAPPTIQAEQVSFGYDLNAESVLRDITIRIPAGLSLAVVGASGSGKSTLADLFTGYLVPSDGAVILDGLVPSKFSSRRPGSINYVPQGTAIIRGTLRENLVFGLDPDSFEESEVLEAVRIAQLADVVGGHDAGLHQEVAEGGSNLSGGQVQRIGLARALISKPKLLVMDEATSSLDAKTDSEVIRAILGLKGKMTSVVVTHRLDHVDEFDLLLVLKRGEVECFGTPAHVRSASREFRLMLSRLKVQP